MLAALRCGTADEDPAPPRNAEVAVGDCLGMERAELVHERQAVGVGIQAEGQLDIVEAGAAPVSLAAGLSVAQVRDAHPEIAGDGAEERFGRRALAALDPRDVRMVGPRTLDLALRPTLLEPQAPDSCTDILGLWLPHPASKPALRDARSQAPVCGASRRPPHSRE
ncbi:MAG TPA: hypothetical protein VJ986_00695 [Gaiellaceae bacterium]|nr:hypothetical protein [Gaiellaceae bacterium]